MPGGIEVTRSKGGRARRSRICDFSRTLGARAGAGIQCRRSVLPPPSVAAPCVPARTEFRHLVRGFADQPAALSRRSGAWLHARRGARRCHRHVGTLEASLAWVIRVLRPIPGLAWVPFAILWFGIDATAAIFIIGIGVFWISYFAAHGAVRAVDRDLIEVAEAFGFRRADQKLIKVILPAAAPGILAGLRTALGQAWMAVVAAEIFGVPGLGQRMMQAVQPARERCGGGLHGHHGRALRHDRYGLCRPAIAVAPMEAIIKSRPDRADVPA